VSGPEQLTFTRKASGLTRGLSAYDAFRVGLFFNFKLLYGSVERGALYEVSHAVTAQPAAPAGEAGNRSDTSETAEAIES